MKVFRTVLIDPEKQTITEQRVAEASFGSLILAGLHDTFKIADHGKSFDYCMVDDTGLSRGEPIHAFQFIARDDPVAGKCLIYGAEKGSGETCDAKFPISTLTGVIRWLGLIVPDVKWEHHGDVDRAVVTWRPA